MRMLSISLFLCLCLLLALTTVCTAASENEASSKIGEADNAIREAFRTVLDVEKAEANVSGLVARLNDAGGVLAEAEMAYQNGDLDEAAGKADQCLSVANGVLDDALALKSSALADAESRRAQALMFSLAGTVVFVTALIMVWVWFKPFCVRRLLKMKPEVVSNAED